MSRTEGSGGPRTGADDRRRLLERLYGDRAAGISTRLEQRLVAEPAPSIAPRPWSHDDVWLIAYPDQFQQAGQTPLHTLSIALDSLLDGVCDGVHVLPFHPSSSDDGFAVVDHRRVDRSYGTWDDLGELARTRRLMVDAVINHVSAESAWFRSFLAGTPPYDRFFRVEPADTDVSAVVRSRTHPLLTEVETAAGPAWVWTTFSPDQVDLDYRTPAVLLEVVDVLLGYVAHGASVIRLDAVGFLWKHPRRSSLNLPETHTIIQLLRSCVDEVAPGTILVTETNVPHRENLSYLNVDRPEAHAVYQFALPPLLADAALTGDARPLVDWAADIDRHVGPGRSYLNFLASHDGIGLRPAEGLLSPDRIDALVAACERVGGRVSFRSMAQLGPVPYELNTTWFDLMTFGVDEQTAVARHLATHAVMLALPGVPALYVHSLLGSSNDREAAERTGLDRSLNRHRFRDLDALLDRLRRGEARRAQRVLDGLTELVRRRRSSPAFHPEGRSQVRLVGTGAVVIDRRHHRHHARWLVNLSPESVSLPADLGAGDRLGPYAIVTADDRA